MTNSALRYSASGETLSVLMSNAKAQYVPHHVRACAFVLLTLHAILL